jgi:predicted DNA-binding transcriptional regulator AlpA
MTDILTAKEVAEELRRSRTQVYRLLNGEVKDVPKLPHISLGRKKVIRRSSFEDWKQTNESIILAATQEMNTDGRMN